MAARGTRATAELARLSIAYQVHSYAHDQAAVASGSYGAQVAESLGVPPERVFKTLIVSVDGQLTVAIVPVAGQLGLKALADAVGGKRAELAEGAAAERATGYVIGGISPLGQRKRLPVVIDATARAHETIFCSAGQRGLQLELAPSDLIRATSAIVAAIASGDGRIASAL